jgi:hypothetical protein
MTARFVLAAALVAATLMPAAALAQQPDSAAMMQAWEAYMTPGPEHQRLASLAGDWTWNSTFWMAPGGPGEKSEGTMTAQPIMDGRYVIEQWNGTVMGGPFEGRSLSGYDNAKKQHWSVWVDNMSTGAMTSWGGYDESGQTMTMSGQFVDPMSGQEKTSRSVMRHVDENHFILEMFGPGPDGKEFKTMELHAFRKS